MVDLEAALEAALGENETVAELRGDLVVKKILKGFGAAGFVQFDEDEITEELSDLSIRVAFDSDGFPLDGMTGVKNAARARMDLQAARDRLISISRALRHGIVKTNKTLRIAQVYLRQKPAIQKVSTAKHKDEMALVALREIVEKQESMKMLLEDVRETLSGVDDKARVLDSWFALHKQYVFHTVNRGPRGEQETHKEASRPRRQLGRRRPRDDAD